MCHQAPCTQLFQPQGMEAQIGGECVRMLYDGAEVKIKINRLNRHSRGRDYLSFGMGRLAEEIKIQGSLRCAAR
ncbi:MAG: hypothetical protein ABT04_03115 [Granulicella sp. SCN 62-9]|nr:MAG: hypothetical protein ABT04_03115 [Granulicella sp. SCN 62-9]